MNVPTRVMLLASWWAYWLATVRINEQIQFFACMVLGLVALAAATFPMGDCK